MIGTSKGFTGQFTDFVAGLDYYGARYYDPVVGVFISADVVQGNGSGANPYGYVGGNPESYNDPSGQYRIGGGVATCAFSGCIDLQTPIVNDNLGPKENPNPLGNDLVGPVINDSFFNDLRGPVVKDPLVNDLPGSASDAANIAQEWANAQTFWDNFDQSVKKILGQGILTSSGGRRPPFNAPPKPAAEDASPDPSHPASGPVLGGAVQTGKRQNQLGGKGRGIPDAGKLVITDAEGNLVYDAGLYEGKGSPSTHTESLAVNDAIDWLQTFADPGQDYNVNIITEYEPCARSCKMNIQSGNWQNQLDDAAYLRGATADLSVWWHKSSQKEFGRVTLVN